METPSISPEPTKAKVKFPESSRRSETPCRVQWSRGYTFGLGKRSLLVNKKGRFSPPPGTYNISSIFDKAPTGPILRGQVSNFNSLRRVSNLPGPGSYDPYVPLGKEAPKYTFKPRINMQIRSKSPGPSNYFPNFRATQTSRFAGISFGPVCDKENKKIRHASPGPGSYEIPNIFNNTFVNFHVPR